MSHYHKQGEQKLEDLLSVFSACENRRCRINELSIDLDHAISCQMLENIKPSLQLKQSQIQGGKAALEGLVS